MFKNKFVSLAISGGDLKFLEHEKLRVFAPHFFGDTNLSRSELIHVTGYFRWGFASFNDIKQFEN